ncbi:fasciclin domain-containing protein [Pseudoflavitalea sp. X16]|uniref:fasciclin domain-containing protein n=1 Tax=Paraflavitalea devenefica TaxID=2716334 RepID=UPI00141E327D|nr:fasciclin domain-containing protein [Paraflavitalea devenefica]NII27983.1 fasciclin domain-containing protein [Paraflavitalea devenefica]
MKVYKLIATISMLVVITLLASHCNKTSIKETTSEDPNILEYLEKDSTGNFTSLVTMINKVKYGSFLNAYGSYTLFAPTNTAIAAYLQKIGKSSVDQLSAEEIKAILNFHILEEKVLTADFNDGKLNSITMYGQFLVTGVVNRDGSSYFVVNRQATITSSNIQVGNGVIQVIDQVLIPTVKTIAQLVEEDAAYSIFAEALKETGLYDTLNKNNAGVSGSWYTLIAETNSALSDSGFTTYANLKSKYCNTGDPKNPADSLHLYVAYHILPDVKYLADIVMSGSHATLAPLEVITNKLVNSKLLVNDDEYATIDGTVHEQGVELDQPNSDMSATNGVVHRALAHIPLKIRKPFPVYWDLCATVPELTRLSSIYRKKTYLFDYGDGNTLADVKWEKSCLKYRNGVTGYLGDYWQLGLGTSGSNTDNLGSCSSNSWIEFTTPLLVKGKYKVWVGYFTQNTGKVVNVQTLFDSVPLTSALVQFHQKISSVNVADEATLEALGWKWWAGASKKSGSTAARMVGVVDVAATGRHKIRFQLVSGSNSDCNLDMVHFIPVGMNQTRPRFNPDGTIEY